MKGSRGSPSLQRGWHTPVPSCRTLSLLPSVALARGRAEGVEVMCEQRAGGGGAPRGCQHVAGWPTASRVWVQRVCWTPSPRPCPPPVARRLASSRRLPVGAVPQGCEVREQSPSLATQLLVGSSVHIQQVCLWPLRQRWSRVWEGRTPHL